MRRPTPTRQHRAHAGTGRVTGVRRLDTPSMRSLARRVRHRLRHGLAGAADGSVSGGIGVADLAPVLYPEVARPDLPDIIRWALGKETVTSASDVRRIISQLDGNFFPSPFQVRFGESDLIEVELPEGRQVLDVHDYSVSAHIIAHRSYEPNVTAAFRRLVRPGMTVVDVGANVGYYALLASQLVGPEGRVIAIEPYAENSRLILLTALVNGCSNIDLRPVAVDAAAGWAYYATHVGSDGGVLPADADSLRGGRGVVVPTFRLDELLRDTPVDFIKLDVEGAEARVVRGAEQTIVRHLPIVTTELSREMLERVSQTQAEDYLDWFCDLGYRLYLLDRETTDPRPYAGPAELFRDWDDFLRIEDALLLPPHMEL